MEDKLIGKVDSRLWTSIRIVIFNAPSKTRLAGPDSLHSSSTSRISPSSLSHEVSQRPQTSPCIIPNMVLHSNPALDFTKSPTFVNILKSQMNWSCADYLTLHLSVMAVCCNNVCSKTTYLRNIIIGVCQQEWLTFLIFSNFACFFNIHVWCICSCSYNCGCICLGLYSLNLDGPLELTGSLLSEWRLRCTSNWFKLCSGYRGIHEVHFSKRSISINGAFGEWGCVEAPSPPGVEIT